MNVIDLDEKVKHSDQNIVKDRIREEVLEYSKNFKTSWVKLGRHLYAIYEDKMYHAWGFNKFEDYAQEEIGIKKTLCLKLLKAYLFVEQDEPTYLEQSFLDDKEAVNIPNYDALEVLRLAKQKKEILAQDYKDLKDKVFKGADAGEVRKELTAMIKERTPVDPEEERDKRNEQAIKKIVASLKSFTRDMETLKLIPDDILEEAGELLNKLEGQIPS